jgi:tetratricopeptide (TPR) repeat protein
MIVAQGLRARRGHLPLRCHVMLAFAFVAVASAIGLATPGQSRRAGAAKSAELTVPPSSLRGEAELSRAYDLILDAHFEDLEAELRRTCGPAPAEACQVLEATSLWWQIQLDPPSLALDDAFSTSVERAIQSTEAWVLRSPKAAEAWFYLGGAYAARVQWRVLRDEKLAAARDGKRIKEALERSLALDPGLDDAYFGIGMYRYYADVAPASARILRFLLLLPGGNRKEGLEQMLRARTRGRLLQGEADYQLHILYLWYERQTERALELLRDLQRQYPQNPLFLWQIADIEDGYQHDITASLASWRTLLSQALSERVNAAELAEVRARFGIARHLDTLARTDEAIEHLERIVELKPSAPYAALSLAHLRLGEAYDRLNARADAMASYRLASASTPKGDPHDVRHAAAERLRRAPNARHAEAFRLSLEGWRQLERKEIAAAVATLEQSLQLNPRDAVTRYRYGRALAARRDQAAALGQFEIAIKLGASDAKLCPAPILGTIYLEAGQLYERGHQRDRAIAAYRTASTLFGAADDTQRMAARALARLESR